MTTDYVLSQPAWQWMGRTTSTMEHGVVIVLCTVPVFIPPLAQGRHIVGRDGADRAVRILGEMSEAHLVVLRHGLDFQREDAQLVHDPGHTVGHHTKVFGTAQHTGGLRQTRQFLHSLLIPELVVATIEIVVVETIEIVLLVIVQLLVVFIELHGNAWMPAVCALMIDEEEFHMVVDAIALYLLTTQAQGWSKLTLQARLLRNGDFPDAEEAQHMVDTIGIKELCHLAETTYPPRATVLQHLVPVVGGEAPVLAIGRERIGGRTSLTVQVEVLRFYPSLHTIARDANGDVALEDDMMVAGKFVGSMHLLIQIVLNEIPELHLLIGSLDSSNGSLLRPLREVGSAILVAVVAEGSIGDQPLLVLFEEVFVAGPLFNGCPLLCKQFAQIFHLGVVHTLVVNLWQGVQFLTQLLKMCFSFFIFDFR